MTHGRRAGVHLVRVRDDLEDVLWKEMDRRGWGHSSWRRIEREAGIIHNDGGGFLSQLMIRLRFSKHANTNPVDLEKLERWSGVRCSHEDPRPVTTWTEGKPGRKYRPIAERAVAYIEVTTSQRDGTASVDLVWCGKRNETDTVCLGTFGGPEHIGEGMQHTEEQAAAFARLWGARLKIKVEDMYLPSIKIARPHSRWNRAPNAA
jgi:hypothetical protein